MGIGDYYGRLYRGHCIGIHSPISLDRTRWSNVPCKITTLRQTSGVELRICNLNLDPNYNVGALIVTYTIFLVGGGGPCYNYGIMDPKALFQLID